MIDGKDRANSKKILLFEMDIGQTQEFWTNWRAGSWFVNFDMDYPNIDSSLLSGVEAQDVTTIGSVKQGGSSLRKVASKEDVQENDSSFYYDPLFKSLYIHLSNGDSPNIHIVTIGVSYGFANHAGIYGDNLYRGRLLSIPSMSKSKDPQFFGVVSFDGGDVTIDNTDGEYDRIAEDNDIFGNAARIVLGFDDMEYKDFYPLFEGFMETISVGRQKLVVTVMDRRKQLSRKLPARVFDATTYPDIKDSNVGKPIPIGYGVIRNAPVICTNEEEDPAPANYDFKLCDTTDHAINEITQVYVDGVEVSTSASSLANGTFSLAAADYDPGDDVTCDFKGFEDALGNLIANGLDVIADLLESYYNTKFNSNFYNTGRWDRHKAPDIGLFVEKETELIEIIGEIAESVQGDFAIESDGRFVCRIFDEYQAVLQTITRDQLLEVPELPAIEYDPTEVLTSVRVGYSKDWAEDEYLWHVDDSQEEDIFGKYKTYLRKDFETLLTSAADAQTFGERRLELSGSVKRLFPVLTKPQVLLREIGDFIYVYLDRPSKTMLGKAKAEIVGIEKNGDGMTIRLDCRMLQLVGEYLVQNAVYYGDAYYGDVARAAGETGAYYGATELRSA
jgi:hypothetical protein